MVLQRFLTPIFLIVALFLGILSALIGIEWVDMRLLSLATINHPTIVVDTHGRQLFTFERDHRAPVSFADLPKHVVQAFIAAEDHSFFSHFGISLKGIFRSLYVNVMRGKKVQGASTITQQLVRLKFLSSERSYLRKLREILLALHLERRLTKEQIFEHYVNNIYFGRGIYGIEAASQRFWGKSVRAVSVDEAAVLASVAKSARYYSPLNAPQQTHHRRDVILHAMHHMGIITAKQLTSNLQKPLTVYDAVPGDPMMAYLQEWIRTWAEARWGRDMLYTAGLTIKTTLSIDHQQKAQHAFRTNIERLRASIDSTLNGGLISLDASSGAIRACIGGFDFGESQFNRAFQASRQMGSSFKPIVYSAALLRGWSLKTCLVDEPYRVISPGGSVWEPRNWDRTFHGSMTLARGLTQSNNILAAKLLAQIGYEAVMPLAQQFGIHRNLAEVPSLALGIAQATVEENAAAFNTFAHDGVWVKPYLIETVRDAHGTRLWSHTPEQRRILPSMVNSKMVYALMQRMKIAKARRPNQWHIAAQTIGKSGSTNGSVTLWFVGATPDLTTAVYIGRDDNKAFAENSFASTTVLPIWRDYYNALTSTTKKFYVDPLLQKITIDWTTGRILRGNEQGVTSITLLE